MARGAGKKEKRTEKEQLMQMEGSVPAKVIEILGSLGSKGGYQIRCKVLEGKDAGKVMRRNVLGPVQIGDYLMLTQTEIEASPLKGGRR